MYYHPLMASTLHNHHMLNAWHALTDVWSRAIERQHTIQADVVRDFYRAHLENTKMLSQAAESVKSAIDLFSRFASEPLRLFATTAQLGEIAADAHRQTVTALSGIRDLSRDASHHLDQKERAIENWQPSTRTMQMMA